MTTPQEFAERMRRVQREAQEAQREGRPFHPEMRDAVRRYFAEGDDWPPVPDQSLPGEQPAP
jgi:hypothetical protein